MVSSRIFRTVKSNPLIVRQRWRVQSKDLNSICFVSRDRDEGLIEVDGSGKARFHDNVFGGTFPCEQVRRVSRAESVSNVEREGASALKSRILEEIEIMALSF